MAEPKIRFCKEDGTLYPSWKKMKLDEIFIERTTTQTLSDDAPQLSFTIEDGVINPEDKKTNKRDFLMKDKDTKKFALTEYNDIIYNPANLKFGAIHRNKLGRGCVSPIYAIFYTETQLPEFMELVVRDPDFIKRSLRYLEGTVEKLKSLKPRDFLQMEVSVPCLEEQQKIASFFADLDEVIQTSEAEVAALEKQKKGAMQKIFSQIVRFKDDKGADYPEWKSVKLSDIAERVNRRNRNNETDIPLTIASLEGLVDQREYFGKTMASRDMSGYYLLKRGEFAYNKSYSVGFDYGSIKRLDKYEQGALSTLYICFALKDDRISDYLTCYFDSLVWNEEMPMICSEGARNHGLLNVSPSDFFTISIKMPESIEEQQKIADFLSDFDTAIDLAKQELEKWKLLKKGLMQQMFV